MKRLRRIPPLTALVALSGACLAAVQASPPQAQTPQAPAASSVPQSLPRVCLDVQTKDPLTEDFAGRLRATIAASGTLSLASASESCSLQLHVPGNLLRFETTGGVMVSTAVIVTSASGHYLSTSISACRANVLKPCAVRAVAAAKLALLLTANDGT